uniref:Cobalamin binding intrinsic factor n=1 Tax=Chelydra serpentina TaxID=8475 RepID=A0A8C3XP57_CHESE
HLWLLDWLLSKGWGITMVLTRMPSSMNVYFSPSPAVPADQQSLVTELQRSMESSVILQSPPNPSILIALNLAGGTQDGTKEKLLVQQIEDRIIKEGTAGRTPEIRDSSLYTGAMATLALTCVHKGLVKAEQSRILEPIHEALDKLRQQILRAVETNTANTYSIGLALQALNVTSVSYLSGDWSCSQTLAKVLTEISQGAFDNPMAAAQILPSLVGKTYLNVIRLSCSSDKGKDCSVAPSPTSHFPTGPWIMVEYTIINQLRGQHFTHTIPVSVPKGSVLLSVLQAAQQDNPQDFSYKTEQTSWGLMVVSINSRAADSNDKTYWEFFNGTEPLDQGVDSYIPSNNEHIKAVFSMY